MPMNMGSTIFTLAFQQNVAENGDVQIERNWLFTLTTVRCRKYYGFFAGKAVDKYIKKAAQGGAKDS
jgi:hypothetical protein